jgi:hypothetical protein
VNEPSCRNSTAQRAKRMPPKSDRPRGRRRPPPATSRRSRRSGCSRVEHRDGPRVRRESTNAVQRALVARCFTPAAEWIPRWVSSQNYSASGVVRLEWSAGCDDCNKSKPLPTHRAPRRAEEWRQLLASGEVTSVPPWRAGWRLPRASHPGAGEGCPTDRRGHAERPW